MCIDISFNLLKRVVLFSFFVLGMANCATKSQVTISNGLMFGGYEPMETASAKGNLDAVKGWLDDVKKVT